MLVIFGFSTRSKVLGVVTTVCQYCANPAAQRVTQSTTWFSLFFIRVLPLKRSHDLDCSFCGARSSIDAASADRLLRTPPEAQMRSGEQQRY